MQEEKKYAMILQVQVCSVRGQKWRFLARFYTIQIVLRLSGYSQEFNIIDKMLMKE